LKIKRTIKNLILKLTPTWLYFEIQKELKKEVTTLKEHLSLINDSYSQEGEDIILKKVIGDKTDGFYVDIGAHHPIRFSNTYHFFRRGWQGINVDAMPGSMKIFNEIRPRDINIEIPISASAEKLTYFMFNEPALNTFSKVEVEKKDGKNGYFVDGKVEIQSKTLKDILERYLPKGKFIDFMNIDVEGFDFEVLSSNDWTKFRPRIVVIECYEANLSAMHEVPTHNFLTNIGYSLFAKTINSLFYII
jgi:FkbM family methyltransferase